MPIICKLPIKTGADVKNVTVTSDDVLLGKIFVDSNKQQGTGSMPNNGAVAKSLSINEAYTIPKGYHNGSGSVSQSLTTKTAQTYTPNDSAQTISSGQYLTGAQTISAVPTETKTVTAGTSATTVSRTSGKYMTTVTVNPTPSQTKTVTMTSSPLTVSPDSGYLLSGVTINADFGRKYASGSGFSLSIYRAYSWKGTDDASWSGGNTGNIPVINTGLSWTPAILKVSFTYGGNTFTSSLFNGATNQLLVNSNTGAFSIIGYFIENAVTYSCNVGSTFYLTVPTYISSQITNLTWEAWE